MKVQVLISTMHQKDYSLLDIMNIQTDAIVVNQCDENRIDEFEYKGHAVKWISLKERGVGLSRNTAMMRADADILLFADDDVVYEDGYEDKVLQAFSENSQADIIVFNLQSLNAERPEYIDTKNRKLHLFNCLRYGAFRIAIRRSTVLRANITYSLLFGGGAKYQAGEDNLFITNCLQKGLKGLASVECLGTVKQETSTWFKGYNDKYYFDKGALFAAMYGKCAKFFLILFELKSCKRKQNFCLYQRYGLEKKGLSNFYKE